MLVLSRRPDQQVHFPNIGVSLKVLTVKGRVVKLGIEAPDDIQIVRPEAKGNAPDNPAPLRRTPVGLNRHDLKNRLNNVKLAAAVFERQRELGREDEADATFNRLVSLLTDLEHQLQSSGELPETSPAPQQLPQRLLVVEDDPNERELLAGLLELYGFDVTTCADGAEALAHLARGPRPDLVLLDMKMPRCSGMELVERIRSTQELADLPLYAVSGSDPMDLGIASGRQGIDEWFPKPLDPKHLLSVLRNGRTTQAAST
jgi:carbon storage regulator CsrA